MLTVGKSEHGTTVELAIGEPILLELPENPTTGFRWNVCDTGAPSVELRNDTFEPGGTTPGAGGKRAWQFVAARPGTANLRFDYKRSWENRVADSFALTIRVH